MKKLMKKIKMNNKGFTLVELIVVVAVLAVITVVAAPQYIKYVEKSKVGTDENFIGEVAHIAEIQWVEAKAAGDVTGAVSFTLNMGTPCTVGGSSKTTFETSVSDMIGVYNVKSDTYKTTKTSVTISLNENGVASWVDSDNVTRGSSTGK